MKNFALALLLIGFLGGAYAAVSAAATVPWGWYVPCAALMLVGLVLTHVARRQQHEDHATHEGNLDTLERSLDRLQASLRDYSAIQDEQELAGLHERIDAELIDPLGDFVDARETMIPRLGMHHYADIMSAFATGERLINRAWSAAADGYVDEVRDCVAASLTEMQHARELLRTARGA